MTFSQEVKTEICRDNLTCDDCKVALLYGMLMCSRGIRADSISLSIENKRVVDLFTQEIIDITGAIVTVKTPDLSQRIFKPYYTIFIEDKNDIDRIIKGFFKTVTNKHIIDSKAIEKSCCKISFLRGVFLICGSIINPEKEYHLEFSISSERLCDKIKDLLAESGFEFKKTTRGNSFILYIKESSQIEEMLTFLSATKATMKLMNLKIVKEVRNNVNRVTNCETANIGKTVNASIEQIEKIKLIKETIGFDALPAELQNIAIMRLMNPEASLREMCLLNGGEITKSGLNHRLKKLMEIADKLKTE